MHYVITTDGEAKPNPGIIRVGVLIEDSDGKIVRLISEEAGIGSNNMAEYRAVIRGLREAVSLGATTATLYTDSQLVERQLRGVYNVKNSSLRRLHKEASSVSESLEIVRYRWHSREEPRAKQADALAEGGSRASQVIEDLACLMK